VVNEREELAHIAGQNVAVATGIGCKADKQMGASYPLIPWQGGFALRLHPLHPLSVISARQWPQWFSGYTNRLPQNLPDSENRIQDAENN
jgi:hypothetical protein